MNPTHFLNRTVWVIGRNFMLQKQTEVCIEVPDDAGMAVCTVPSQPDRGRVRVPHDSLSMIPVTTRRVA